MNLLKQFIVTMIMILSLHARPRLSLWTEGGKVSKLRAAIRFSRSSSHDKKHTNIRSAHHPTGIRPYSTSIHSLYSSASVTIPVKDFVDLHIHNKSRVEVLDKLLDWNVSDFLLAEHAEEQARRQKIRRQLEDSSSSSDMYLGEIEPPLLPLTDAQLLISIQENLPEYCAAMLRYVLYTFRRRGKVPTDFVVELLNQSLELHRALPNIVQVRRSQSTVLSSPTAAAAAAAASDGTGRTDDTEVGADGIILGNVTVVGDTHGQYLDFACIFDDNIAGLPSMDNQFVFNGDLVDRGDMGSEIVLVTLLAKLLTSTIATNDVLAVANEPIGIPTENTEGDHHQHQQLEQELLALYQGGVHILRGNHETTAMNARYGFQAEVLRKYDAMVLGLFRDVFDPLPLGAVVEDTVFVVHGGLGPLSMDMTIQELNKMNRFKEPDHRGAISELLWCDPRDDGLPDHMFAPNGRGIAYYFGKNVTESFLKRNAMRLLIRSHEVFMDGFQVMHEGLCLSVFSAPNYCGQVGNLGAVVRFEKPDTMNPVIRQFAPASFSMTNKMVASTPGAEE